MWSRSVVRRHRLPRRTVIKGYRYGSETTTGKMASDRVDRNAVRYRESWVTSCAMTDCRVATAAPLRPCVTGKRRYAGAAVPVHAIVAMLRSTMRPSGATCVQPPPLARTAHHRLTAHASRHSLHNLPTSSPADGMSRIASTPWPAQSASSVTAPWSSGPGLLVLYRRFMAPVTEFVVRTSPSPGRLPGGGHPAASHMLNVRLRSTPCGALGQPSWKQTVNTESPAFARTMASCTRCAPTLLWSRRTACRPAPLTRRQARRAGCALLWQSPPRRAPARSSPHQRLPAAPRTARCCSERVRPLRCLGRSNSPRRRRAPAARRRRSPTWMPIFAPARRTAASVSAEGMPHAN